MITVVLFFGCIDKAPSDASLFRRTLTLRIRNHAHKTATAIAETAWSIEGEHPALYEPLIWISEAIEPKDYLKYVHCRDSHAITIRQYTLFSNWSEWGVEDRILTPIPQEEIDAFLQGIEVEDSEDLLQ